MKKRIEDWAKEGRRGRYFDLWDYLFRFFFHDNYSKYCPLNIEQGQISHYMLSLLDTKRTEMVESLTRHLKPTELYLLISWIYNASSVEY